ncbi:hypothetical protein ACHAXA_005718 [Cyclostephanos tholiformis]|uniref:DRTGG domain-containing protein n=1 Tax=Cyclostephanos tholiformis TaxID=382380 RepID=A0ABD3RFT4_9STRA
MIANGSIMSPRRGAPSSLSRLFSSDNRPRPIFVAATKQHVGKTTTSLALMSGLQKRFPKVGFIKPVGQQHVKVWSPALAEEIRVDKDICLLKEQFHLDHIDYRHMSPVIIPRGYTKKFINGEITYEEQMHLIRNSYDEVSSASDVVLCEGTGHCAVGSIVSLNNAKVASMLGASMLLIANGGLGSAFDELELNRVLCEKHNVPVLGVIINKVLPDKYDQTKHYMSKALQNACIPDRPFLGCPALADLEKLFDTELVCGNMHRFRHYSVKDMNLITTSLTRFLENIRSKDVTPRLISFTISKLPRTLYICHVTRDDIILGFMAEYQRSRREEERPFEAALLVCGRKDKYQMADEVRDMFEGLEEAPVMVVGYSTHEAMQMIHDYTPKLNIDDKNRVRKAVEHYEPYIDFEQLLHRASSTE